MERCADPSEGRPLRHRLQVVDGFVRLDFDHAVQAVGAVVRREDQIGKQLPDPEPEWGRWLTGDVHADLVPASPACVEQADHPVVLELLTNRTNQNGTHEPPAASPRRPPKP